MTSKLGAEQGRRQDDLNIPHLTWLVNSRTANQNAALKLLQILEDNKLDMKTQAYSRKAQALVSICFSLWRAAFLADKEVTRDLVQVHARSFLGKMLIDNAITYPQDRITRNWTFNYYMNNATSELTLLAREWDPIKTSLESKLTVKKGETSPQRRWNRTQRAFEIAIGCLEKSLEL